MNSAPHPPSLVTAKSNSLLQPSLNYNNMDAGQKNDITIRDFGRPLRWRQDLSLEQHPGRDRGVHQTTLQPAGGDGSAAGTGIARAAKHPAGVLRAKFHLPGV